MNFETYTKAELIRKLKAERKTTKLLRLNKENLFDQVKQLTAERNDWQETVTMEREAKSGQADYIKRELETSRRLFMELYEEQRTTKLRFGWLEEAATDAVNACEKHEAENMDRLRDELGLEMRGDS